MPPNPGRIYEIAENHRAALLKQERQAAGEMVHAYGSVWQRIRRELDDLLAAIADARRAGEDVTNGWLFRRDRLQSLLRQVEAELHRFTAFADPLIVGQQRAAIEAALLHTERQVRTLANRANLSVAWTRLPTAAIEDLVGFTADGSPLRRLLDTLGGEASAGVRDALIQGVALGQNPTQIARTVRTALGGSLARALTISRTEVLRAYREATLRSYQANDDVVDGWIWNCACQPRSCAACWAMHGSWHPLTERLNDHPNGRCSMLPSVKPVAGMAEQWRPESGPAQFKRLTPEQQDHILGKAAGAAYRAGAFKLEDVAGESFSPAWGSMIRVKSLRELVGKEEARDFTNWSRVLDGDDQTILRTALHIAQRRGIMANYENDAQIARLVTDGILRIPKDEWLPRQISVDAEWFPDDLRRTRIASFDPDGAALLINPQQEYWHLSTEERSRWMRSLHQVRFLSTEQPLHPVLHELGHAVLWQGNRTAYLHLPSDLTPAQKQVALVVSQRAALGPSEFMAEVFTVILSNRPITARALALYRSWGGLEL